jgi:hypothetical protein
MPACPPNKDLQTVLTTAMTVFDMQVYARDHDRMFGFLTYADNNAVGYFTKQGFTKEITMPKERVRIVLALEAFRTEQATLLAESQTKMAAPS